MMKLPGRAMNRALGAPPFLAAAIALSPAARAASEVAAPFKITMEKFMVPSGDAGLELYVAVADESTAILGEWHGTSTCTDRVLAPACNDEVVVYEFTRAAVNRQARLHSRRTRSSMASA